MSSVAVAPAAEPRSETSANSLCSCRICQTAMSREQLISPCNCKGSLGRVHLSCLERWLNACNREHCEICRFRFQSKRTRRYTLCQSIRIWVRHPRHRAMLRSDLLVATILTVVTLGLCCVSALGMQYFVLEGIKFGVSSYWTHGTIIFLLSVIVLGYSATIYLMMRDHVVPWYRWWNRSTVIKLVIAPTQREEAEAMAQAVANMVMSRRQGGTLCPPAEAAVLQQEDIIDVISPPIQV